MGDDLSHWKKSIYGKHTSLYCSHIWIEETFLAEAIWGPYMGAPILGPIYEKKKGPYNIYQLLHTPEPLIRKFYHTHAQWYTALVFHQQVRWWECMNIWWPIIFSCYLQSLFLIMDDLNDEQFIDSLSLTNRIIYIRRKTTNLLRAWIIVQYCLVVIQYCLDYC